MEPIRIEAIVEDCDGGKNLVLNRMPVFCYCKIGNFLISTDDLFMDVYHKNGMTGAFGGREFDIPLNDGTSLHATGEWWAEGHIYVSKKTNLDFVRVYCQTEEKLKKNYVFSSCYVEKRKLKKMLQRDGIRTYSYYDYKKVIRFDYVQNQCIKDLLYEKKAKRSAIMQARVWKTMWMDEKRQNRAEA